MKLHSYDLLINSLSMDIRKGNEVCFLFGSAISLPDSGIGMPSVDEMVDIIAEYLSELGDDGLEEYLKDRDGTSRYQAAFEYLLAVGTQEDVKVILKIAVDRAKDTAGQWVIPKTIRDFTSLVKSSALRVRNILTTNFDPLIEESLRESVFDINRIELTDDINFDSNKSHNNERINVIHLHGYYEGDTLHTPDQLTTHRDESISCLRNIFSRSKLYIIGYGGWDDIINKTIMEMVNEKKGSYEFRWAFYSDDENTIHGDNNDFFTSLQPAKILSRFNAYKNVDCRKLFEDVNRKAHGINLTMSELKVEDTSVENTQIISLADIYNPPQKTTTIKLNTFPLAFSPSHEMIRLSEQESAREYMKADGSVMVISGIGYGKLEFTSSFLRDDYPEYDVYRLDCSGVNNREEAKDRFLRDIGVDFTTLVASHETDRVSVILFDNITELNAEMLGYFNEIISILKDYSGGLKGVFYTNRKLNLSNNSIELLPLNLADINEYLRRDVSYPLTTEELERISLRSSGLPRKLDSLKDYFSISTISHVLNTPSQGMDSEFGLLTDSIPKHLVDLITELSKAESEENRRVYSLLQVLCIIECGETPENIMKQFRNYKFKLDDFLRLVNNGLVHSITVADFRDFKINRVNPIVKDFVRSKIDKDTFLSIRMNAIKMVSGDIWSDRHVTVSRTTKVLLNNIDFQPGNAHLLIADSLKTAADPHEVRVYCDAAVSYSYFLERKCRYKEVVSFVNEVLPFISEGSLSYFRLINYLSESMRMLDREEETIEYLEGILEEYNEDNKFYNKSLHESMTSTLLLAYSKRNQEKAFLMAEKIKRNSEKNSYRRFLAESILTERISGSEKVEKLRRLEKKARNYNEITIANNISLDLAVLDPASTDRYINTVLNSEKSDYTRIRAILKKMEGLLSDSKNTRISSKDIINLSECYKYLFIQRIDGLFNRCHALLWQALLIESRLDELFDVFLSSSLVWRISGHIDKERAYSKEIIDALNINAKSYSVYIAYLYRRSSVLSEMLSHEPM
ncbi:SIR2 family protein [Serratia bockelmannii]|uniref:SIR2 family protein n=1 Tax=Serratia bockelmannii TaxID=2703793 RepID=UPI003FA6C5E1